MHHVSFSPLSFLGILDKREARPPCYYVTHTNRSRNNSYTETNPLVADRVRSGPRCLVVLWRYRIFVTWRGSGFYDSDYAPLLLEKLLVGHKA